MTLAYSRFLPGPRLSVLCLFYWLPGSLPSHQGASLLAGLLVQDHSMVHLQRVPFIFCGLPGDHLHWSGNVSHSVAQQISWPLRERCGVYREGADER